MKRKAKKVSFNKKTGNAVAVLAFTVLITALALSAKNISTEKKESKTAKSVTESVADTENVSDTELVNSAKKIQDTQKADTEASEQNNSNSTDNAGTSTDISGDVGKSGSKDAYETNILKNDESETDEDDGTSGKDGQVNPENDNSGNGNSENGNSDNNSSNDNQPGNDKKPDSSNNEDNGAIELPIIPID